MAIRFERKTENEASPSKKMAKDAPKPVEASSAVSDDAAAPASELPFGKPVKPDKKRKGR